MNSGLNKAPGTVAKSELWKKGKALVEEQGKQRIQRCKDRDRKRRQPGRPGGGREAGHRQRPPASFNTGPV